MLVPWLKAGDLPHLAALMERGAYGTLRTFEPTSSPVIWTTIATGKPPRQHGIRNFARRDDEGNLQLYTNADRRTKALWNILTDHGRTTTCIGWWMTWPVDEIAGVMVAQTNTLNQLDTSGARAIWKGALFEGVPGQVHPPSEQAAALQALAASERTLDRRLGRIFGTFEHPLREFERRLWDNCRWAFRADATYLAVALDLFERRGPSALNLVYFGGPDVVGHRFWRYMFPELYEHPPQARDIENFGGIVRDYYRYVDAAVGKLVAACPPDTTVVVVSDHGMQPVNRDARFPADDPPKNANSAHHHDAPPGVLIAAGPHVAAGAGPAPQALELADLREVGTVFDLTPTLLTWLGLPVGRDMPGRVLEELTAPSHRHRPRPAPVATHDTPEFLASRPRPEDLQRAEAERIEQLQNLGYIDDE